MEGIDTCCCCLSTENELNPLKGDYEDDTFCMLIGQKMEFEGFKKQACTKCANALKHVWNFRELCRTSVKLLTECSSNYSGKADVLIKTLQKRLPRNREPSFSNTLCIDVITSAIDKPSSVEVSTLTQGIRRPRNTSEGMTILMKKVFKLEEDIYTFTDEDDGLDVSLGSAEECIDIEGRNKLEEFLLNDGTLECLDDIKMELSDDDSAAENVTLCQLARIVKKQSHVKGKRALPLVYNKASMEKSIPLKKKGNANYSCCKCGKTFQRSCLLNNHTCTSRRRSNVCSVCDRAFASPSKLKEHSLDHSGERPYSCEECGKTFKKAHILKAHKRIHLPERPFPCDLCNSSFLFQKNLLKHRKMHTGDRPHICKTCGKSFVDKTYLKRHEMIHMDEITFTCDECGLSFAQLSKLNYHKLSHKDERPFSCEECGKTFKLIGQLNNHKSTHTGVKPFTCDVCGRSFRQAGNFNCHKRVHTGERPFTCNICGNTYTEAGYLKKHIRIHTGEKPFTCDVCGKSFIETCGLRRHKLVHTGEQRYSCSECGALFKQPGGLRKHKRKHVAEKLCNANKWKGGEKTTDAL